MSSTVIGFAHSGSGASPVTTRPSPSPDHRRRRAARSAISPTSWP